MPISSSAVSNDRRKFRSSRSKTPTSAPIKTGDSKEKEFLTIGPALPPKPNFKLLNKSNSKVKENDGSKSTETLSGIHPKEKEPHSDRICLDRRGLTRIPLLDEEPRLRLLSLQHNLITSLEGFRDQTFQFLVFLDIYDNQVERINYLEKMENLRVLLLGKNRIKKIEGLHNLPKIEVLDLHGNQIESISGLSSLSELKVLNLAGNQLKNVGINDFQGLISLQELNLRRNKIRKLLGFGNTPNLIKLFLSNNDIQSVEDMSSIAKLTNVKEIAIDNNPVFLNGDCASFLVSFLPHLTSLNSMQITDQVRKAAMAWRRNKESTNASFMDLSRDASLTGRREEVISNARTNWELLRSQTKCLTTPVNRAVPKVRKLEPDVDFILTSFTKPEPRNPNLVNKEKKVKGTIPALTEKKLNVRMNSLETDHSSSNTGNEFFRLPPILVPLIDKMEQKNQDSMVKIGVKLSGSLSSIGPNVDSSVSSLNSTRSKSSESETSDESETETESEEENSDNNFSKDDCKNQIAEETNQNLEVKEIKTSSNNTSDSSSNISTNTAISNITIPSASTDLSNSKSSMSRSTRSVKSAVNSRIIQTKLNARAATAKPKKTHSPTQSTSNSKEREQGGDYLIEICGRHLNIFGQGALRFIDKPWSPSKANDVTTINFNYANFNGITSILSRIKLRFPNAENFTFKETNVQYLGQINALAEIQGLVSLTIGEEGNPICSKPWKNYAIYRLSHWGLKSINGEVVGEEQIAEANSEYQSLSDLVLWSLPEPLLQPLLTRLHIDLSQTGNQQSAKKWLLNADPALKSVVSKEALQWKKGAVPQEDLISRQKARVYCSSIIDQTCYAIQKLRLLDRQWPSILQDMVQNTLLDYSQLDVYMKRKMKELL